MPDDVVSAQTVVMVLRGHGVDVFMRLRDHGLEETIMISGETIEVQCFGAAVSRRILGHLIRKFAHVPIHHFYHPEQAPQRIVH